MFKPAFRFPDDGPLDEAGRRRFDEQRLAPLIETLHALLRPWLDAKTNETPPRLGVMGGLGQGKSTVLRCCLERLEQNRGFWKRIKYFLFGRPIAQFDVSYFKADDLEWRFVAAVLGKRVLLRLLWQGPLFGLVTLGVFCLMPLLQYWSIAGCLAEGWMCVEWLHGSIDVERDSWVLGVSAVVWLLGECFSGVGKVLTFGGANTLYLSYWDLLVQWLARFASALPRVVVIDDLDRASVEQQRSFLRAICRLSRELNFAVVVCMDDSDLLAAPPNPEVPEELLRKTLTDELRLPDRSREDVAILAMTCLREMAKSNAGHELALAVSSVQFVADVTRVLLLADTQVPPSRTSPRKIIRMLGRVVRHAEQLKVKQADDLSALLRLDGFFQLAPCLRRYLDDLRQVLEGNRDEAMLALLGRLDLCEGTKNNLLRYFQSTAMMQPRREDGWFRLLGGFSGGNDEQIDYWQVSWKIGARSHDFFRLFLDGATLSAAGYRYELHLRDRNTTAAGEGGYTFDKAGGRKEDFAVDDLPERFLEKEGDYQGQGWLLWVCAITTCDPLAKAGIFEQAYAWCGAFVNDDLRRLYWRECLADRVFWVGMPEAARDHWWSRALQEKSALPLDHFFAHALLDDEFADAWSVLKERESKAVDTRRLLHWWRSVVPAIRVQRLPGCSHRIDLQSELWPVPGMSRVGDEDWKSVLLLHVEALNCINGQRGQAEVVPGHVLDVWRDRQAGLSVVDKLDILFALACDTKAEAGLRWGVRSLRFWLEALDENQLAVFKDLLEGRSPLPDALRMSAPRCLTLLLLAAVLSWKPSILGDCARVLLVVNKDVREAGDALENAGLRPAWWPG